ncbi:MAG TPA: M48 family metallopeptidase [Polyangiaceae bacterium]
MSRAFEGRLFGPGLPGPGQPSTAEWSGTALRVRHADTEHVAERLEVGARGLDADQIQVSWKAAEGAFTFWVQTPAQIERLLESAPDPYRAPLAEVRRERERLARRFRWAWLGLGLVLGLGLGLVALALALLEPLSARLAERVSREQEAQLGELVLAETRATTPLLDRGPAVQAVRSIGERLVPAPSYQYRWYVAESPELNAFAAPGGIVVVHAGLIRAADSPEELAGVLAHEVAHSELRHGLRALLKSMGLRALVSALVKGGTEQYLGSIAAQYTELQFSRDAEREADRQALERLAAARIDARPMLSMFEKLAAEAARQGAEPPEFLSTHPDLAERIASLQAASGEQPRPMAIAVDWKAVQRSLAP